MIGFNGELPKVNDITIAIFFVRVSSQREREREIAWNGEAFLYLPWETN